MTDTVLLELGSRADTAEHEQLGGFEDALGDDDFAVGEEVEFLAGLGDDGDTLAGLVGVVDDESLGVHLRQDGDVCLVSDSQEATGSTALVDRVDAVGQTNHLTVEDVLVDGLASGLPGLSEQVTEGLHLGDKL